MELTRYGDILKENGLEWKTNSMKNADVSNLNAQCVLALLWVMFETLTMVRVDFKSGCILKWLERLNSIE